MTSYWNACHEMSWIYGQPWDTAWKLLGLRTILDGEVIGPIPSRDLWSVKINWEIGDMFYWFNSQQAYFQYFLSKKNSNYTIYNKDLLTTYSKLPIWNSNYTIKNYSLSANKLSIPMLRCPAFFRCWHVHWLDRRNHGESRTENATGWLRKYTEL